MSDGQPEALDEAEAAAHGAEPSDTQPGRSSGARAAADRAPDAAPDAAPDPAPGGPEERVTAESAATADPRVDDALSRLGELDALPLTEQVEVYTDIHRRLAAVLSDPDSQA
jgi:hypothetical protein